MLIKPDWPAPNNVRAYTTLRRGGVSKAPFHEWNLAFHVGDLPEHVTENRKQLRDKLNLANEPIWIEQTHSTIVVPALSENRNKNADASFTQQTDHACAILTADCLPILLCNKKGTEVAAIHAGWRGIYGGVIEATCQSLHTSAEEILAWFGPAIGPNHFEVRRDMHDYYLKQHADSAHAFRTFTSESWLADIYELARVRLAKIGVKNIYGGNLCTASDTERFYSYRRDKGQTGRMASLIWLV